jgi:hypothetical protein
MADTLTLVIAKTGEKCPVKSWPAPKVALLEKAPHPACYHVRDLRHEDGTEVGSNGERVAK